MSGYSILYPALDAIVNSIAWCRVSLTHSPVCYQALLMCKQEVMERFNLKADEVEVSMGMSNDFEQAVSVIYFHRMMNKME